MNVLCCDLCGKPITDDGRFFRIKEHKRVLEFSFALDAMVRKPRWVEIDAHDKCVQKLMGGGVSGREKTDMEAVSAVETV